MNVSYLSGTGVRFLVICICLTQFSVSSGELENDECFRVQDYFWKHLASKTPYRYVANRNDTTITFEGCRPKKIWVLIRHGTRYPGMKFINKMRSRLVELQREIVGNIKEKRTTICEASANNLTLWVPQMELADGKRLSHEGEDEMVELAERFQNRFPSLLGIDYTNSSFEFRTTATERTKQSKYYFLIGLFGRRIAHHVWSPEPIYNDPILRFYKLCTKWLKEVHKHPQGLAESHAFKHAKKTRNMINNVSHRLGFVDDLSFDDVDLMYTTCTYESAINRAGPSPWCYIFTKEDMEIMEFIKDLKHYWIDGYGFNINFQQACPLLRDMLQHMESDNGSTSIFYFTHSGTLLKLLSHLGLYYDETKLTHDRFVSPRLWKVGHIDAFGSNLAFVSYQCGDEVKLLPLHQERAVQLPGCRKDGLCSLKKIMKTYGQSFRNCDFDAMCKL